MEKVILQSDLLEIIVNAYDGLRLAEEEVVFIYLPEPDVNITVKVDSIEIGYCSKLFSETLIHKLQAFAKVSYKSTFEHRDAVVVHAQNPVVANMPVQEVLPVGNGGLNVMAPLEAPPGVPAEAAGPPPQEVLRKSGKLVLFLKPTSSNILRLQEEELDYLNPGPLYNDSTALNLPEYPIPYTLISTHQHPEGKTMGNKFVLEVLFYQSKAMFKVVLKALVQNLRLLIPSLELVPIIIQQPRVHMQDEKDIVYSKSAPLTPRQFGFISHEISTALMDYRPVAVRINGEHVFVDNLSKIFMFKGSRAGALQLFRAIRSHTNLGAVFENRGSSLNIEFSTSPLDDNARVQELIVKQKIFRAANIANSNLFQAQREPSLEAARARLDRVGRDIRSLQLVVNQWARGSAYHPNAAEMETQTAQMSLLQEDRMRLEREIEAHERYEHLHTLVLFVKHGIELPAGYEDPLLQEYHLAAEQRVFAELNARADFERDGTTRRDEDVIRFEQFLQVFEEPVYVRFEDIKNMLALPTLQKAFDVTDMCVRRFQPNNVFREGENIVRAVLDLNPESARWSFRAHLVRGIQSSATANVARMLERPLGSGLGTYVSTTSYSQRICDFLRRGQETGLGLGKTGLLRLLDFLAKGVLQHAGSTIGLNPTGVLQTYGLLPSEVLKYLEAYLPDTVPGFGHAVPQPKLKTIQNMYDYLTEVINNKDVAEFSVNSLNICETPETSTSPRSKKRLRDAPETLTELQDKDSGIKALLRDLRFLRVKDKMVSSHMAAQAAEFLGDLDE